MEANVNWVAKVMESFAPTRLAYDWDNVGLLVGETSAKVKKVITALDLTEAVLDEAISLGAQMVVTHHPIMRKPLYKITDETNIGAKIIKLAKNNIALYSAHTNMDIADGGTNDLLFDVLGLGNKSSLLEDGKDGLAMGRTGELISPLSMRDFIVILKKRLGLTAVPYVGDSTLMIKKIGLCTGSCSGIDFLVAAKNKGCDVYICGDLTYHNAQAALEMGLTVIDGTHFGTEHLISEAMVGIIKKAAENDGVSIDVVQSKVERSPILMG